MWIGINAKKKKSYSAICEFRDCQSSQQNPMRMSVVFCNSVSWDIETMRPIWALKYTQDTAFIQFSHDFYHNVACVMERVKKHKERLVALL